MSRRRMTETELPTGTAPSAKDAGRKHIRCAIYTRKSSEEGLEQEFNSLDAQREVRVWDSSAEVRYMVLPMPLVDPVLSLRRRIDRLFKTG